MTKQEKLAILKKDLQMLTTSNDDYLVLLLEQSAKLIEREGIKLVPDDIESEMLIVQYSAYLFRKRASKEGETGMPRFLRYQLNNMLLSQKGRGL